MDAWSVLAGGLIGVVASLATALVTHWLKRDERREAAREEFERERMAALSQFHREVRKIVDANQQMTVDALATVCLAWEGDGVTRSGEVEGHANWPPR
jgi:hypothetical protein